jgi:hypothetical protein
MGHGDDTTPAGQAHVAGSERREHPRIAVRLDVHFQHEDKRYGLVSENLSLGGIFLKGADGVCREGDELALEMVVAGEDGRDERHSIDSVVVQIIPGAGAGIRFVWGEGTQADREALERYILRAGMLNDALLHEECVGLATDAEELR